MERGMPSDRGNGQSAPGPAPRIGRKDLQDPDRDVTDRPAPGDEQGHSDHDADAGRPVQLEIPATEQQVAGE